MSALSFEEIESPIANLENKFTTLDPLEGIINKIKVIKRVAYGSRSFWNFEHRIFVIFKLTQKNSSTVFGEAA